MASNPLSWAAIASKDITTSTPNPSSPITTIVLQPSPSPPPPPPQVTTQTPTITSTSILSETTIQTQSNPRVAFISGHIDINPTQFRDNYAPALDAANQRGDTFVLSNAGGADTLALAYLRAKGVSPGRITIYMHSPRENRKKLNATQVRINAMRLGAEVEEGYRREGYKQRVVQGYHNQRDAAMTEASDHDILWVRRDEDTRKLYGWRYRPGRVSGTQKNRDRRVAKEAGIAPMIFR